MNSVDVKGIGLPTDPGKDQHTCSGDFNELDGTSRRAASVGSTAIQPVPRNNFGNDCSGNIKKQSTNETSTHSNLKTQSYSIL